MMQNNQLPPAPKRDPGDTEQPWIGRAVGKGVAIGLIVALVLVALGSILLPTQSSDDAVDDEVATDAQTLVSQGEQKATLDRDAVEVLQSEARSLLEQLPVSDALLVGAPVRYVRDDYDGQGWTDDDGNCVNARHEVLVAESEVEAKVQDCRVIDGRWVDWMTGETLSSPSEATVDHVVPLGHAHRAGGWQWSPATKRAFANDLTETSTLNIAGADANQSKGSSAPDEWRPADSAAWCGYAVSWIRVKARWNLATSVSEAAALNEMLDSCDGPITVGVGLDFITTPVEPATIEMGPPGTEPTATAVAMPGPPNSDTGGGLAIISCDRRAESVTIISVAAEQLSLAGWRLHDRGANHTYTFDKGTLEPGETVSVLTGDAYATGDGVKWKTETIWNNDGDTAFLLDPNDNLVSQRDC